jgi:hypothetical protein
MELIRFSLEEGANKTTIYSLLELRVLQTNWK